MKCFVLALGLLLVPAGARAGNPSYGGIDRTRSLYFPADQIALDAAQCVAVAAAIINTGPKVPLITCADNAAGILYGHAKLPDQWDSGPLGFTAEVYTDAADPAGVVAFDCSCEVRGTGDTLNATWGTAVAADVDLAPAAITTNDQTSGSSAAATCNGASTAIGARQLFWRCVIDAATTTATPMSATAASSDYFPSGVTVEYGITGAGD